MPAGDFSSASQVATGSSVNASTSVSLFLKPSKVSLKSGFTCPSSRSASSTPTVRGAFVMIRKPSSYSTVGSVIVPASMWIGYLPAGDSGVASQVTTGVPSTKSPLIEKPILGFSSPYSRIALRAFIVVPYSMIFVNSPHCEALLNLSVFPART